MNNSNLPPHHRPWWAGLTPAEKAFLAEAIRLMSRAKPGQLVIGTRRERKDRHGRRLHLRAGLLASPRPAAAQPAANPAKPRRRRVLQTIRRTIPLPTPADPIKATALALLAVALAPAPADRN